MDQHLLALLEELSRFGQENDAKASQRTEEMLNITPDTGEFLSLMVGAIRAHHILEVGTSNGYSTIWLADAARRLGGKVTTLEVLPYKAEMARANFRRARLEKLITLHLGDAGEHLRTQPDASYDLIFLDSNRPSYPGWWPDLQRVLVPGGLIIVDNATSHPAEMAPFAEAVAATPGYQTSLLPLGKGELLILKSCL